MAIERISWPLIARLIEFDRGIESLDVTDHERHPGAAGRRHDGAALLHRRRNRLLDHDVKAARDAVERQIVVQMGGCRDGHRLDPGAHQRFDVRKLSATQGAPDEFPLGAVGIDHPDQRHAGHFRQDARMVAAHDANADHPNFQWTTPINPAGKPAELPRLRLPPSP